MDREEGGFVMRQMTAEDRADLRADVLPPPPRQKVFCATGMCGASDCANCFPLSWDHESKMLSEEEASE